MVVALWAAGSTREVGHITAALQTLHVFNKWVGLALKHLEQHEWFHVWSQLQYESTQKKANKSNHTKTKQNNNQKIKQAKIW